MQIQCKNNEITTTNMENGYKPRNYMLKMFVQCSDAVAKYDDSEKVSITYKML